MILLPINSIQDDFSSLISHKNAVVQSETGSGKSTHLPCWAAELGRVLVIEPRRIACTALAEYLSEKQRSILGEEIGYAIKLDAKYTTESRIVFVTPGIALKWFMEDKLRHFSVVMIDEFHERRWDSDLLLSLLNAHNQHRLILTSATIESERLARYINADVLQAKGREFPVDIYFKATQAQQMPSSKDVEKRVMDVISEQLAQGICGDILVFMPGKKEITHSVQMAVSSFPQLQVLPLYAGVADEIRKQALAPSDGQRCIFATNIAETSLTIPNITVVIDSGLEKRTHQRNGRTTLSLHAISHASAAQRAGRAGRTQAGIAVRLYGEFAPLEKMTPPELQREELVEPVLAAASCEYALRSLTFLEPLPEKALSQAEKKLQIMKAINMDLSITPYGLRLFPLPIDTLFAHIISIVEGNAEQESVVDLVAALSVSGALFSVANYDEAMDEITRWNPLCCDFITLISIVRGHECQGVIVDKELQKEARQLAQQIREELTLPDLSVSSKIKRDNTLQQLVTALPELVYIRREKRREAFGNGIQEVLLGRNNVFLSRHEAAIVFDQFSLPGRGSKQTLTIGTAFAPIDLSWIVELGLTTTHQGELKTLDSGKVTIAQHHYYAKRLIATVWHEPDESNSIQVIVSQVMNGQILPALRLKREAEIAAWTLYCQLNGNKTHQETSFEVWFIEQLEALGVSSIDDMALFEESDFLFEGIPEWELVDFLETYPQTVELPEITLSVEYFPSSKRILLHYQGGGRKGDVKRWELPTWLGWRIQYKKASRTIDIR